MKHKISVSIEEETLLRLIEVDLEIEIMLLSMLWRG